MRMWRYRFVALVIICMMLPSVTTALVSSPPTDEDEYVVIWGSFRPAGRESVHSYGIAVDVVGNVYVDDPVHDRIRTYTFGDLPDGGDWGSGGGFVAAEVCDAAVRSTPGQEWTVGPGGDDDFSSIQEAIDAASDGDTILIKGGTYREDVVVNKRLTLDGNYDAVINGRIILAADGCTLAGLMVVREVIVESDNNAIEGVADGWYAPDSYGRDGFIISGSHNTFTNCLVYGDVSQIMSGMRIEDTAGNTFNRIRVIDTLIGTILKNSTNTTFRKNGFFARSDAFIAEQCTDIAFIDCSMRNTDYSNAGVALGGSSATFTNCKILGNLGGVFGVVESNFTNCYISGGTFGVCLGGGNTFMNCDIHGRTCCGVYNRDLSGPWNPWDPFTLKNSEVSRSNCDLHGGISDTYANYTIFNYYTVYDERLSIYTNCTISGYEYGVYLDGARMDVFTDCRISGEGCGVYQGELSDNNTFTRCTVHGNTADWCGYAHFHDTVLEGVVRDALNIPVGSVSAGDMAGLAVLSASDRGISSLAGLEYGTNLEVLDLDRNRVSDLWPLAGLTNLRELIFARNELADLSPLVRNSDAGGLGPGDLVDLRYNGLDLTPGSAAMTAIGILEAREVIVLSEPQVEMVAPRAAFMADVAEGPAPLTVAFTDCSRGEPTEWFWDFGDGTSSTEQHPVHTYTEEGVCTVSLTVTNQCGCDTMVDADCICVHAPHPAPVDEFPAGGMGVVMMVMVCGVIGAVGMVLRKRWEE